MLEAEKSVIIPPLFLFLIIQNLIHQLNINVAIAIWIFI